MNRLLTKTADPYFAQNRIGASSVSFGYTASGKRSFMSDASGLTSYRYDSSTDLLSQIFNSEGSASYSYDLAGNLTGIFGPGGAHYYYDQLNRLRTVQWQVGNNQLVANYGYDAAGNLQSVSYPNGVLHNYSYNVKNQLTNLAVNNNSGAIASYAYTLDAAGHRTQVTELGGRTVKYGYDSLYRLTSETISGASSQNGAIGYVYDAVGNRTSMTSTVPAIPAGTFFYDANDRRSTDVYDADGNTVSSGGLNYVYDFENHLVQQGGATFVYDGDGNRVQKIVARQPECRGMCQLARVSRAGFYRSLKDRVPLEESMEVRSAIQQIALEHRRRYGYRCVTTELRRRRMLVNPQTSVADHATR